MTNSKEQKTEIRKEQQQRKLKIQLTEYSFKCQYCGEHHTIFVFEWAVLRSLRYAQEERCKSRLNQMFDN